MHTFSTHILIYSLEEIPTKLELNIVYKVWNVSNFKWVNLHNLKYYIKI